MSLLSDVAIVGTVGSGGVLQKISGELDGRDRPVGRFFTRGYHIAVRALYELFESRQNKRFSLARLLSAMSVDALHKLPETTLWDLFVTKLLTGHRKRSSLPALFSVLTLPPKMVCMFCIKYLTCTLLFGRMSEA